MIEFVFTSLLMVCLSTVLYLMVRALPRIVDDQSDAQGFFERWARSELPEKFDQTLNSFLLKFLRKTKVVILKLDNKLAHHLQRIKPEEEAKRHAIDFREISGDAATSAQGAAAEVENLKNLR
jgi:hypothetical protein